MSDQVPGAAARIESTTAGSSQAPLVTPLSAAELSTGDGYGAAITSIDMTPRPRYGESRERFEARMRGYGFDFAALKQAVAARNRKEALRSVHANEQFPIGVTYWTACACGFCGLRVGDPELARREYDTHPCAAESIGDDAVTRAQVHAGRATLPAKRTSHVLAQAFAAQDAGVPIPRSQPVAVEDEAEQRFALLELK